MFPTPEPFSRILIDKALETSGWNLLDPRQVRFEVHAGGKRADYVLMDSIGRTLCVLEAKRGRCKISKRAVGRGWMKVFKRCCIERSTANSNAPARSAWHTRSESRA